MNRDNLTQSPFARRLVERLHLGSIDELIVSQNGLTELLVTSPGASNDLLAVADSARPDALAAVPPAATPVSFRESVTALGIELENELNAAVQLRRSLEVMRNYRAPKVSEADRQRARVDWPPYTIWNYESDVKGFAERHQRDLTTHLANTASEISAVAGRMKENVQALLGLLDQRKPGQPVDANEYKKRFIFLETNSKRGNELATSVQRQVVTLNQGLADLRVKATTLRDSHKSIVEKLKQDYNQWARREGKPQFDRLQDAADALKKDIAALQQEISNKEREMTVAGSVGTSFILFFGLGMVASAIAVGVLGGQRVALINRMKALQERANILEGALGVQVFLDSANQDLNSVSELLGHLQKASDTVGKHFLDIAGKFVRVGVLAQDNLALVTNALEADRKDLEFIVTCLEEIVRISDHYGKHALQVTYVPNPNLDQLAKPGQAA